MATTTFGLTTEAGCTSGHLTDGADAWEEAGRASDLSGARLADQAHASGTSIPETVLDEYVMMRLAELIESGTVADTIDRALRHGNFGGEALAAKAESIKNVLNGF